MPGGPALTARSGTRPGAATRRGDAGGHGRGDVLIAAAGGAAEGGAAAVGTAALGAVPNATITVAGALQFIDIVGRRRPHEDERYHAAQPPAES